MAWIHDLKIFRGYLLRNIKYIYILYYIIIIYIYCIIYIYVYIYVYSCSQKMDAVQKFVVGCQRAAVANDCVVD